MRSLDVPDRLRASRLCSDTDHGHVTEGRHASGESESLGAAGRAVHERLEAPFVRSPLVVRSPSHAAWMAPGQRDPAELAPAPDLAAPSL